MCLRKNRLLRIGLCLWLGVLLTLGGAVLCEAAGKLSAGQQERQIIDFLTAAVPEIRQMASSHPANKLVLSVEHHPDPASASPVEQQYYRVYVGFNVEDGGPGHRSRWATFLVNSRRTDILWQNYLVDESYVPLVDWQKYVHPPRKAGHNDWMCIPFLRAGPIEPTSSIEEVTQLFGAQNVSRRIAYGPEGMEKFDVTAIYAGTADEILVYWRDNIYGSMPERVSFRQAKGRWRTVHAIKPGTGIAELNRINGRPFDFYGFGWDYGGIIDKNWNGGALSAIRGLSLRLTTSRELSRDYYGDRQLRSDLPGLLPDAAQVGLVEVWLRQ